MASAAGEIGANEDAPATGHLMVAQQLMQMCEKISIFQRPLNS